MQSKESLVQLLPTKQDLEQQANICLSVSLMLFACDLLSPSALEKSEFIGPFLIFCTGLTIISLGRGMEARSLLKKHRYNFSHDELLEPLPEKWPEGYQKYTLDYEGEPLVKTSILIP